MKTWLFRIAIWDNDTGFVAASQLLAGKSVAIRLDLNRARRTRGGRALDSRTARSLVGGLGILGRRTERHHPAVALQPRRANVVASQIAFRPTYTASVASRRREFRSASIAFAPVPYANDCRRREGQGIRRSRSPTAATRWLRLRLATGSSPTARGPSRARNSTIRRSRGFADSFLARRARGVRHCGHPWDGLPSPSHCVRARPADYAHARRACPTASHPARPRSFRFDEVEADRAIRPGAWRPG